MNPNKVIEVAKSQVGYLEKKSDKDLDSKTGNAGRNNYTKYGEWFGVNPVLWCAVFVCWCFAMAYGSIAKEMLCGGYSAACETMRSHFIKAGRYNKEPKVGDCIFFSGTRHAGANHIGLVWKIDGSRIYTIEGNTSGANGVVDNGGGVAQKSYSKTYSRIMGYGHPKYDESNEESSSTQNDTQKIEEDGEWGRATTTRAQEVFGTPIDGIVSKQVMKYKKYLMNCLTSSWKFYETPSKYKGGSDLIRAIQEWCGAEVDGICGRDTIRAMQDKLDCEIDGWMGEETVTAFQKYLNSK